nr:hypothetical protein [Tanacetum cinerariifolium]
MYRDSKDGKYDLSNLSEVDVVVISQLKREMKTLFGTKSEFVTVEVKGLFVKGESDQGQFSSLILMLKQTAPKELFDASRSLLILITVIIEYLVNIHSFWCLNEDILKINDSDYQYVVSIKEDTAYSCLHFTRNHEDIKANTPYPEASIRRIQGLLYMKILEDIKHGPYSKKAQYAVSHNARYGVSNRLPYLINRRP